MKVVDVKFTEHGKENCSKHGEQMFVYVGDPRSGDIVCEKCIRESMEKFQSLEV
jgi:hypothetical protein